MTHGADTRRRRQGPVVEGAEDTWIMEWTYSPAHYLEEQACISNGGSGVSPLKWQLRVG